MALCSRGARAASGAGVPSRKRRAEALMPPRLRYECRSDAACQRGAAIYAQISAHGAKAVLPRSLHFAAPYVARRCAMLMLHTLRSECRALCICSSSRFSRLPRDAQVRQQRIQRSADAPQ